MKVVSIVGARPQFVKAAAVCRELREKHVEVLVHTGQHYDESMSAVFFDELDIPAPDYHLEVGSGSHAAQTGSMLVRIAEVLAKEKPDWVLIYGDTNSTLAGALAAAKLLIPVAHVEAGLRSFNRRMPEEVNRILADRVSTLLLCPSRTAVENLAREGIRDGVRDVGDVMYAAVQHAVERARGRSTILEDLGVRPGEFMLATIHRAENTNDRSRLRNLVAALDELAGKRRVIFPVHPRTRKILNDIGHAPSAGLTCIEPVGYLDMVRLEQSARMILTDSGGVQKEAYWLGVPCVTLREETEWVETVAAGWNRLSGADTAAVVAMAADFTPPADRPALYGDAYAAQRCVAALEEVAAPPAKDR